MDWRGESKERNKKDPGDTSKLWLWHHQCYKKDIDKRNLITPKTIINGDPSGSHLSSKDEEWLIYLWQ